MEIALWILVGIAAICALGVWLILSRLKVIDDRMEVLFMQSERIDKTLQGIFGRLLDKL
jgi:hypothetical protein